MSGKPNDNYDTFNQWAEYLRNLGYEVLNPAENFGGSHDHPEGRAAYMRADFEHVLQAEAIFVLPGWDHSLGSCSEVILGLQLGLPVYDATHPEMYGKVDMDLRDYSFLLQVGHFVALASPAPIEETVCQEAERLVSGDRGPQYGHPTKNFEQTAQLWKAYTGYDFTPAQVAVMMILLKISRESNRSKRDNIVDMIGYAKTLSMVHGYE